MKKNMGSADKIVRVLFAIIIAILYFTNQITGAAAIVLGVIAVVLILTSVMGFCPLYSMIKLSTIKKESKA